MITENRTLEPAFEQNNIPVILMSSNMYAPYAGVLIQSLIDHASTDKNYDIIIFERRISAENKRLLKQLEAGRDNISIRFFDPSFIIGEFCIAADGNERFPLETYYDLFAPFILNRYKKIIIMDSDMLLCTDIAKLLNTDLEGASIAAVPDVAWQGHYSTGYYHPVLKVDTRSFFETELELENGLNYVNTGILLLDCEKWCQEWEAKKILDIVQKKHFVMADQDFINFSMSGKIKSLPISWNIEIPTNRHIEHGLKTAPEESRIAYAQALENPCVLHWAGRPKPWTCPDVPYGSEWWAIALRTPFVGHILSRMIDELEVRRAYYLERYGEAVPVWEPMPQLKQTAKS